MNCIQADGSGSEQIGTVGQGDKTIMATEQRRYLLTGGGTGGHVYPAIAIADELRRREPEASFLYVGVKGKAEEQIVEKRGYPLVFVKSQGWPGARPSLALLQFVFRLTIGILQAIRILRKFQPHVIVATGGYVSAPILLAWVILKRLKMTEARTFVHEQNLVLGRMNQVIGQLADRVGVSFEETCHRLPRAEWVGYPTRTEVGHANQQEARKQLGIPQDAKVVLAFGGSQGARSLNRATVKALPRLLKQPDVWVIHGVGRFKGGSYHAEQETKQLLEGLALPAEQRQRYRWDSYLDPIELYYAASDVAIGRAGAGTLTELSLCGLPCVIIPKANLPGDHQVRNARALEVQKAVQVVYERTVHSPEGLIEEVDSDDLATSVETLLADTALRQEYSDNLKKVADRDALLRITDVVQCLSRGENPPLRRPPALPADKRPELSDMTGSELVNFITRQGLEGLSTEERDYLAYRSDGYLAHSSWQSRNIGVKLVGLLRLRDRLDLILYILQDKTPAPRWQRWLGGDYRQVGFIRRNAVTTLKQLDFWGPKVRQVLLDSLQDPYFEVQVTVAETIIHFSSSIGEDKAFYQALDRLAQSGVFEVRKAAYHALSHIDTRTSTYERMKADFQHPNWLLRSAILQSLQVFVRRGILSAQQIEQDLDQFLLTSTGFRPQFALREQMKRLSQTLEQNRPKQP